MRIVIFCMYMPDRCGAFFHDYIAAKYFIKRGHTVNFVYTNRNNRDTLVGVYRGVPFYNYMKAEDVLKNADIFTTPHYPIVPLVRKLNEKFQKPIVITVHFGENLGSLMPYEKNGNWSEAVFFVSNYMKNHIENVIPTISSTFKRKEVSYPIMLESDIKLPDDREMGKNVTLVNGNLLKGVDVFLKIANEMKDTKFLGIKAYYGNVVVTNTDNLSWDIYSDDIRNTLLKTRVLLVPSRTESWSRIAFEAMYNGIPVLYSKPYESDIYPGGTMHAVKEWIGDAAIACDRENIQEWVDALKMLEDPEVYSEWSIKARDHARSLDMFKNVERYEQFLASFIKDFPSKTFSSQKSAPPQAQAPQQLQMGRPPQRLSILGGRFGASRRGR